MDGKLFQLMDNEEDEFCGLVHVNSNWIDNETIENLWKEFSLDDENYPDVDVFAEFLQERLGIECVRIYTEEISN